jgi:hypothetical protein
MPCNNEAMAPSTIALLFAFAFSMGCQSKSTESGLHQPADVASPVVSAAPVPSTQRPQAAAASSVSGTGGSTQVPTNAPVNSGPKAAMCGEFPPAPRYVGPGEPLAMDSTAEALHGHPLIAVEFDTWESVHTPSNAGRSSSASMGPRKGDYYGFLRVGAVNFKQRVFHSSTVEPHQCCVGMFEGQVAFECYFSGASYIVGRGVVAINQGQLTVRWCTTLWDAKEVIDKGERSFMVNPQAGLRLAAPQAFCSPKDPLGAR